MLIEKNLLLWKVASRLLQEKPEEYTIPSELLEIPTELGCDREEYVQMMRDSHQEYIPDKFVPPELLASARELGCNITVETFPAEGFTQRFQEAIQQNEQPDILTFVDYGIISGFNSHLGEFQGLNRIEGVLESLVFVANSLRSLAPSYGGWQVLINTSRHHQEAKLLALKEPKCTSVSQFSLAASIDRRELEEIARDVARSYLEGSITELKKYLSSNSIISVADLQVTGLVRSNKICLLFGNENIAIVSTIASFDGAKNIGNTEILMVFEKEENSYRLLTISNDPVLTINKYFTLDRLAERIANASEENESQPQPAVLLSPEDGKRPSPEAGLPFGNFKWQISSSKNVIAEVVEFSYLCNARLFVRFREKQNKSSDRISEGLLFSGLNWRWRVWSIAKNGAIAFSETRTFGDR